MSQARQAVVLVMAKMALADGQLVEQERECLEPLLEEGQSLQQVVFEAASKSLGELVAPLESYADRFFVVLRAAGLSCIDAVFDLREESLLDLLVREFGITPQDCQLIAEKVETLDQPYSRGANPRIEALYAESSFAGWSAAEPEFFRLRSL